MPLNCAFENGESGKFYIIMLHYNNKHTKQILSIDNMDMLPELRNEDKQCRSSFRTLSQLRQVMQETTSSMARQETQGDTGQGLMPET
jgi:hypothetical protein